MPTSSNNVIGPTGKPNCTIRSSSSSIAVPCASRCPASFMYGVRIRFTQNPGLSFTTIAVFPMRRPNATAVVTTPGAVRADGITSSNGMRATGEKKCMPITCSGRRAASAMRPIGMVDVLDANTARSGVAASTSPSTWRLTARSSNTASMTRSARPKPAYVSAPDSSATSRACSYFVRRRRFRRSSRISRAAASPFATRGRSASFIRTSTPAWTTAVPAIPDPMNPEPTTPRRRTSAGGGGLGTPKSFLSWLVAKKIWTSLRETSVTASWPNNWASRFSPWASPGAKPYATASSAASRAGKPELGLGVIGRHPVMARQGELEAAAQAGPVDADGDRLREARHALQQLLTVRDEALGFGGARERDELLDVGARDEVVRLAREERHGPHRALALERFERREEVGFQRARDLVDRFALHVERDDRDPVGQLPAECGSRHQRRSRHIAKTLPPCAPIAGR